MSRLDEIEEAFGKLREEYAAVSCTLAMQRGGGGHDPVAESVLAEVDEQIAALRALRSGAVVRYRFIYPTGERSSSCVDDHEVSDPSKYERVLVIPLGPEAEA